MQRLQLTKRGYPHVLGLLSLELAKDEVEHLVVGVVAVHKHVTVVVDKEKVQDSLNEAPEGICGGDLDDRREAQNYDK